MFVHICKELLCLFLETPTRLEPFYTSSCGPASEEFAVFTIDNILCAGAQFQGQQTKTSLQFSAQMMVDVLEYKMLTMQKLLAPCDISGVASLQPKPKVCLWFFVQSVSIKGSKVMRDKFVFLQDCQKSKYILWKSQWGAYFTWNSYIFNYEIWYILLFNLCIAEFIKPFGGKNKMWGSARHLYDLFADSKDSDHCLITVQIQKLLVCQASLISVFSQHIFNTFTKYRSTNAWFCFNMVCCQNCILLYNYYTKMLKDYAIY